MADDPLDVEDGKRGSYKLNKGGGSPESIVMTGSYQLKEDEESPSPSPETIENNDSKPDAAKRKRTILILLAIIAVLFILLIIFISLYGSAKNSSDGYASSDSNKGAKNTPTTATTTITDATDVSQNITQNTKTPVTVSMTTTSVDVTTAPTKEDTKTPVMTTETVNMTAAPTKEDTKTPAMTTASVNMTTAPTKEDTKTPAMTTPPVNMTTAPTKEDTRTPTTVSMTTTSDDMTTAPTKEDTKTPVTVSMTTTSMYMTTAPTEEDTKTPATVSVTTKTVGMATAPTKGDTKTPAIILITPIARKTAPKKEDTKTPATVSMTTTSVDITTTPTKEDTKTPSTVSMTTKSMHTTTAPKREECKTQECHDTANRMAKLMDMDADPCVDFSEFACGKFYKEAVIPDDRARIGPIDSARNETQKLHEELLTGPLMTTMAFEVKMRSLYNACMDIDEIEQHGLSDYTTKAKEDWPTLNQRWTSSSFDLQSVINKHFGMFNPVLFSVGTLVDKSVEPPVWILGIGPPELFFDKPTLMDERNSTKIMALQTYYKEFSIALGAPKQVASVDAKEFVDMIRELGKLKLDTLELDNVTNFYNPTTLGEMDAKYPYLNWTEAVQSMFDIKTKKIEQSQKVNIIDTKYIEELEPVISKTDGRIIQNMFGFFHARELVAGVTRRMREIELNFKKINSGVEKLTPRNEQCVKVVDSIYNYGMAKLVFKKKYSRSGQIQPFINRMIANLKKLYIDGFESLDWIGFTTKRAAVDKVTKMKEKKGIPRSNFEDLDIENMYKDYIVKGQFNRDRLQNVHVGKKENWNELGRKIERWRWPFSVIGVNTFYSYVDNMIGFPLSILQPPFFYQDSPGYLNYGAFGSTIGHEIGHGFDSTGRYYDEKGSVQDWWTPKDKEKYEEKTKCFVDQYSGFNVTIANSTYSVDGDLTKTGNVPDAVGLKKAYTAYKMYQNGLWTNELPLPNLGLSNDQLFFLSFAQVWCSKSKPEEMKTKLKSDSHSPGRFRIIGSLQNNPEFAKVYKCKAGDYMNPAKKCILW